MEVNLELAHIVGKKGQIEQVTFFMFWTLFDYISVSASSSYPNHLIFNYTLMARSDLLSP